MDGLFFLFALIAVGAVVVWTVVHGGAPGLGDTGPELPQTRRKPRRA